MAFGWDPPPRVIGHRGSPREATENTIASFEACLRAGVAAIELDARMSVDGEIVVHHDAELGRAIAGSGRIEDLPAAALVAKGIPRLADVLALDLLVNVEIKGDADNASSMPASVLEVVRRAGALDRVLVSSFDHALADDYARRAERPAGMIVPYAPDEVDLEAWPRLTFLMLAADAAIPVVLASANRLGRRVVVWTVNDEPSAKQLLMDGAAGIITDRPGPLSRTTAASATGRSPR